MPYRISRLGYVEMRCLDLDTELDHFVNVLGLQMTGREGKQAFLKGWDERHSYSIILTEADKPGMERMAFRTVSPEDLEYYEHRLQQFSVPYDVIDEDFKRGKALRFKEPAGHTVELYYQMEYTGNALPEINPDPWPQGLRGIGTPRMDHALITAPDPTKAIRFFENVLEFRASEYVVNPAGEPIAAWLWQRPAPHDIAIVPGNEGGLHHVAFTVDSADAIFRAADILSMNKVKIDYGPGRHGITRGTTIYFFAPSGNRLETFGGYTAYQMEPDFRPIHWTEKELGTGVFYYERELVGTFMTKYT
jgi:catechol 2,3-dioxygenase